MILKSTFYSEFNHICATDNLKFNWPLKLNIAIKICIPFACPNSDYYYLVRYNISGIGL